jgi:predicted polyphosphate/ATP-dependent NAD kinase
MKDWFLNVLMFPFEIKSKLEKLIRGELELSELHNLIRRSFVMAIIVVGVFSFGLSKLSSKIYEEIISKNDTQTFDNLAVINKEDKIFHCCPIKI